MAGWPDRHRMTLVGLISLAVAMGIGRFAFTPLLPLMVTDGRLGIADGGVLASVHFAGYLMGALVAARLPVAPRPALKASLIGICAATLGMGLIDNLPAWMILRWLAGVLSAFVLVLVSSYHVRSLDAAGETRAQGWIFSGVGAGIAAAGLGTLAIMAGGWGSSAGWIGFGLASLVLVLAVLPGMGSELAPAGGKSGHRDGARGPLQWRLIVPYAATGLGYIIPATYLPVMAREIIQSPLVFGWAWPIFGVAALISTVISSRLQARFSNRRIWIASQLVMALGMLLPAVYPHIASVMITGLAVGGTFMIITMMGMKEAHRLAPPPDATRQIAAMTAAFASGQILGPVVAGYLYASTGALSAPLALTSLVLIATVAPLFWRPQAPGSGEVTQR